jgi:hypothetical protein
LKDLELPGWTIPLDQLGPADKGESLHDLSCKNLILLLQPIGTLTSPEERVLTRGMRVGVKKRAANGVIKDRLAIPIPNMSI